MLQIQSLLFNKSYQQIPYFIEKCGTLSDIDALLVFITKIRYKIYQSTFKQEIKEVVKRQYQNLSNINTSKVNPLISCVIIQSMKYFMLEVITDSDNLITQQQLTKQIQQMKPPSVYNQNSNVMRSILSSLYLSVSYLELQIKKLSMSKKSVWGKEINNLLDFILEMDQKYPDTNAICQKSCVILIHMAIHYYNSVLGINNINAALEFLLFISKYYSGKKRYLTSDCLVVLVYNCVKILLGVNRIPTKLINHLKELFQLFDMTYSDGYGQNLLQIFFIIKILIFTKPQSTRISQQVSKNLPNQQGDLSEEQKEEKESISNRFFVQKLSIFLNVNLDTVVVALDEVVQNIIKHRVASLATLICFKLGLKGFSKNFIELMYDSPFNNDIQTIKLCFQLFDSRQFSKLEHLFQVVLSAPSCKHLKERQVLLAMCSIFTGLYLSNREQGLLYAKLNHQENKRQILREQTLLQHVGFAYYNLANHEPYLSSKQVFLTQALLAFNKSYQINPNNYLLTYCIAKIYLTFYDYDSAYKYAIECCRSGRGTWIPFSLLACVYMCQKRVGKAGIIVDQLLKKYEYVPLLYFIRAYIEVNKILMDVECDQELESSSILGQQLYCKYRQKILKSKSINCVLRNCQFYHQILINNSMGEFNQNYFHNLDIMGQNQIQSQKAILSIIGLLIQLDQFGIVQTLLNNIPSSSMACYYKAQLHQKKQEISEAKAQYVNVLLKQPYQVQSLVNLALLELETNIQKCSHYLTLANKFCDQRLVKVANGMLLSKLGKIREAHEEFLKQNETAWCKHLPDIIYYY